MEKLIRNWQLTSIASQMYTSYSLIKLIITWIIEANKNITRVIRAGKSILSFKHHNRKVIAKRLDKKNIQFV